MHIFRGEGRCAPASVIATPGVFWHDGGDKYRAGHGGEGRIGSGRRLLAEPTPLRREGRRAMARLHDCRSPMGPLPGAGKQS